MEKGTAQRPQAAGLSPQAHADPQHSGADAGAAQVVNAFDPWARDRGEYYSLEWKPRPGAESDPAFKQ